MSLSDEERRRQEAEFLAPDGTLGIIVVVLSLAGLVVLFLVPAREGAPPGGKLSLAGFALIFLSYGVRLISQARAWKRRHRMKEDLTKDEANRHH
jgi:hypothetical protein